MQDIVLSAIYFLASCVLIVIAGKLVIDALIRISRFLHWKEFVVAFFTVSLGAVLPELFIGVTSALRGLPELSLGNVFGQNIVLFTLAPALCVLMLKHLEMESRTVRAGSTFAILVAILPLLLILNGELSRADGVILISCFFFYIFWLFSKKERFSKIYDQESGHSPMSRLGFLKDLFVVLVGMLLIVVFAHFIVSSAEIFSEKFNISPLLIGILIIGLGVALPETFLVINLARKGECWMILGSLMGAVAMSSTLVLGVVSLISPITVSEADLSVLQIARIFLIISAVFFLLFSRTGHKITLKEGLFLLGVYITFLMFEIFSR